LNNLFLPDIDFSQPPEFNHRPNGYWSLKNPSFQKASFFPFLNPEECKEVIKLGNAFTVEQSSTGGEGFTGFNDIRKSLNSWVPPCELTNWFWSRLDTMIKEVNEQYYQYDLHSVEHLQYTVYDQEYTGMYGPHIDPHEFASTPDSFRKLSFSIQLSDPESYEGGDLLIYQDGIEPVVAPKQLGLISFFPSYTIHEVTPVTKGTRISGVGWIHGPRFK